MNHTTRNILILVLLVLFAVGVFLSMRDNSWEITNYPSSGTNVVVFGDSLVYGVGAQTEGGFVTMLSEDLGIPIENLGRGGDTTVDGLVRLPEVLATDPKVVMVLLGGNDFLKQIPREETFENYSEIIHTLQDFGAVVVVLGVRGGLLYDSYDNDYEDLARTHGAAYVPNVLDGLIGDPDLMDDTIHPSEAGYLLIADKVRPVLESVL